MRWLIWYIKSCFCKHEFKYEEAFVTTKAVYDGSRQGLVVSVTCSKCGYHKSYWKFGK